MISKTARSRVLAFMLTSLPVGNNILQVFFATSSCVRCRLLVWQYRWNRLLRCFRNNCRNQSYYVPFSISFIFGMFRPYRGADEGYYEKLLRNQLSISSTVNERTTHSHTARYDKLRWTKVTSMEVIKKHKTISWHPSGRWVRCDKS